MLIYTLFHEKISIHSHFYFLNLTVNNHLLIQLFCVKCSTGDWLCEGVYDELPIFKELTIKLVHAEERQLNWYMWKNVKSANTEMNI